MLSIHRASCPTVAVRAMASLLRTKTCPWCLARGVLREFFSIIEGWPRGAPLPFTVEQGLALVKAQCELLAVEPHPKQGCVGCYFQRDVCRVHGACGRHGGPS